MITPAAETRCNEAVAPSNVLFDPTRPAMRVVGPNAHPFESLARKSQRHRRSVILAATRQLLMEEGYRGVTVRRIADISGFVVQTIYNLVGPREHAIVEAITDYTLYIGRLNPLNSEDPGALIKSIEWQGSSVTYAPEFTRQVCLIYFTADRHVFYEYRGRQERGLHSILVKQRRSGVLRRDVNCGEIAKQLMMFSSALFIEWADRPFNTELLVPQLRSGYAHILAGTISPKFGGLAGMPLL